MRYLLAGAGAGLALLALSACAGGVQHAYDDAARRECRNQADAAAIDVCLARVAQNSHERTVARRD